MEQIFDENGYPLDMSKIEFLSNKGSEFIVYKYYELVIKIYKADYKLSHLSLEELNILRKIPTQRILLPTGTLWNINHELIGYKMPFISGERTIEQDSVRSFFEALELLRHDLDLLSNNSVILIDVNLSNTIYNGQIYLIDPGNYLINALEKIIFRLNITNPVILDMLHKVIIENDYSKIKTIVDSLPLEERQRLITKWNYDKINKLIIMLLFAKRDIDFFQYRQFVQFIMKVREKEGFAYDLDVLKMFFNKDLCVSDAIDDFIKKYLKDDPEERRLLLNLYK